MQRGAGGSAQRFGENGLAVPLGRSRGDRAGGAERSRGAQNRADVAGILHPGEHHQQRRADAFADAQEIVESGGAASPARRLLADAGVRDPSRAIGGAQNRNGDFPGDRSAERVVRDDVRRFAEKHRLDGQPERKASSTRRTPSTPTKPDSVAGRAERETKFFSQRCRAGDRVRSCGVLAARAALLRGRHNRGSVANFPANRLI